MLLLLAHVSHSASSCVPVRSNSFCTGVTWNVSLGQPAEVVDGLAKHDFEAILAKQGRVAATPACLEAWKALQCASKFQKCTAAQPARGIGSRGFAVALPWPCRGVALALPWHCMSFALAFR